jgi:hypothetical protein
MQLECSRFCVLSNGQASGMIRQPLADREHAKQGVLSDTRQKYNNGLWYFGQFTWKQFIVTV